MITSGRRAAARLMTAEEVAALDRAVSGLVRPNAVDGVLDLPVAGRSDLGADHRHGMKLVPTALRT
jgi:hypothetical protein